MELLGDILLLALLAAACVGGGIALLLIGIEVFYFFKDPQ